MLTTLFGTKKLEFSVADLLFVKDFNLFQKRFQIMKIPGMISVGGAKSVLTFVVAATAVNALAEFASVNLII